ncbi:MAG TPA: radical SAM protein, partial [Longimicrobiales bacterium]|nr:radical SAM protein [Longimicrobiales bacterium]
MSPPRPATVGRCVPAPWTGPGSHPAPDGGVGEAVVASVYVHAPFCARRCTYCDFAVQVRRSGSWREWVEALERELSLLREEGTFRLADRLDTVYVGGGTPSLLGPGAMAALGRALGRERVRGAGVEWTAEANPESFTPEVAKAWRRSGVNRVSLGVQTFHSPSLRWMGRLHGPGGALRAVGAARKAGFQQVGVDLILGLPERLGRSWRADLDRIV